jgi:hypothetical protein
LLTILHEKKHLPLALDKLSHLSKNFNTFNTGIYYEMV